MGGFGGGLGGEMAQTAPAMPNQAGQPAAQSQIGSDLVRVADGEADRAAYMASLDVELPVRGREYFFTTPRGEVELSAQGVSTKVYQRLYMILGVLVIAAGAWGIYLLCMRLIQTRLGITTIFSVLVLFGVFSLIQGLLPVYGGIALLAAVMLAIVRLEMHAPQAT
jgi:hypothetical protein